MDFLFFCRDGLYDSLINQLTLAMSFQKSGKKVGMVFTSDALKSLIHGGIRWPHSLSDVETKRMVLSEGKKMNLSLQHARDPKAIDIKPLLLQVKETGVTLYACPIWSKLLKLSGQLPESLCEIGMDELMEKIQSCSKVLGVL